MDGPMIRFVRHSRLFFRVFTVMAMAMLAGGPLLSSAAGNSDELIEQVASLPPMRLDQEYPAMSGPVREMSMRIGEESASPYIWIREFKVTSDEAGKPLSGLEFLCHSSLLLGGGNTFGGEERLLTISQGMEEMRLPEGFGLRVPNRNSNGRFSAQGMNENNAPPANVTFRMHVKYVPEEAAQRMRLRPLRGVTVAVYGNNVKWAQERGGQAGGSRICRSGMGADGSENMAFDVPPGRHEYESFLLPQHKIYRGGTIHFIKMHMHAYGESVSLVDVTENRVLWKGTASTDTQKKMVLKTDDYSSATGIRLNPQHVYKVKTVYNNASGRTIDAMGLLRMYVADDGETAISRR
jgi:hypothetical protein